MAADDSPCSQPWLRFYAARTSSELSAHPNDLLTVGEVVARTGVAPSAFRFYEAQGLITAERNRGNQRLYRRHMLRRMAVYPANSSGRSSSK